jgi:tetratricopeptide (TPR) repeat protein
MVSSNTNPSNPDGSRIRSLFSLLPVDPTPADEDFVTAVRELVQRLVALDVEIGGEQTSALGLHSLSVVRHRLHQGQYNSHVEQDLQAAAAELAELTGWLLIDANRHRKAERVNNEALRLARAAGDRHMELFVTYNMSLQATFLRRPEKALALAQPFLGDDVLTSRLAALFQERVARTYAQMGLRNDALNAMARGASLLYDGVSDRDPAWSWWVTECGLAQATGALFGSLGDWQAALDPMQRALEISPGSDRRDRFRFLCILLRAQLEIAAWRDAQSSAENLIALIGTVGSPRPMVTLTAAIKQLRRSRRLPSTLEDTLEYTMRPNC